MSGRRALRRVVRSDKGISLVLRIRRCFMASSYPFQFGLSKAGGHGRWALLVCQGFVNSIRACLRSRGPSVRRAARACPACPACPERSRREHSRRERSRREQRAVKHSREFAVRLCPLPHDLPPVIGPLSMFVHTPLQPSAARNLLFSRERTHPRVPKQILRRGVYPERSRMAQDDRQRECLVPMAEQSPPFAKTI